MSFIADEYADVLIFFWDMLCKHYVETSVQTAGVYVCMYSPKKQQQPTEIASSLTLDPNVPLSLCITYIDIMNTHTHTEIHIVQDQKCAMTK